MGESAVRGEPGKVPGLDLKTVLQANVEALAGREPRGIGPTGQIILFGLTGGLIPCPAAITVLLLCLQVKEVALGAVLVLCFSIGLAITLVTVGAAAAIGARQASNRWPRLGAVARRAPYLSSLLIIGVGIYVGVHGWIGLNA